MNVGSPFYINPQFTIPLQKQKPEEETSSDIIDIKTQEAEAILKEAQEEVERIMEETKLFAEQTWEDAKEQGFSEGMAMAKAQYQELMEEAEMTLRQAKQVHDETMKGLEQEVVDLTIAVVQSLISDQLQIKHEIVLELIKKALERSGNKDHIVIKLSEQDYIYLNDHKDILDSILGEVKQYELKKISSFKPGDLEIETDFGIVDASLERQILKVKEAFLTTMHEKKYT